MFSPNITIVTQTTVILWEITCIFMKTNKQTRVFQGKYRIVLVTNDETWASLQRIKNLKSCFFLTMSLVSFKYFTFSEKTGDGINVCGYYRLKGSVTVWKIYTLHFRNITILKWPMHVTLCMDAGGRHVCIKYTKRSSTVQCNGR